MTSPDFVLLGSSGFLGNAILQALQKAGHSVVTSSLRLKDRLGIERLLDESKPTLGVIVAAGERGRPNITWCETHPVETFDANITGQFAVAAACHERGLHVVLLGTGALYNSAVTALPSHRFTEEDPPNANMNVYIGLRAKMEEMISYFDNALILRVLYPTSSDLDPRGLIGKLARFAKVHHVETSVTINDDLFPLLPELVKRRRVGILNFVNTGTISYPDVVTELARRAPASWKQPELVIDKDSTRSACELDVRKLEEACGKKVPSAVESLRRIISSLSEEELRKLLPESRL